MTAPVPSAPISTSRFAHARAPGARPPAARARGDRGARRCRAWGRGCVGRGRRRPERSRRPSRGPARPRLQRSALRDQRLRRSRSSGSGAGRVSTISRRRRRAAGQGWREGGRERIGGARAPAREPAPGRAREGEGPERALGPEPGEPARRSRAPALRGVGEGDAQAEEGGRAGAAIALSRLPPSFPPPGRPAAGRPKGRRLPGEGLTYTVNELVAPRVQFLPKAASLNGALLPPTHPRHLLPPARPCLRRGPAHAQPRRPGPRTHPRPGRRASRRGRRGGRAGLTSRWPRRGPGGGLGARPSRTQRRAAVSAVLASRPSPASHVRSSAPRASRRSRAVPQGHGCPCFSLPGAFCFLNHPCLSFSTCLWPDTNCCKFCVTASLNF